MNCFWHSLSKLSVALQLPCGETDKESFDPAAQHRKHINGTEFVRTDTQGYNSPIPVEF